MRRTLKLASVGLGALVALSACGGDLQQAPKTQAAPPEVDFTLERKPLPGDPASAALFDDAMVLRVFGDRGGVSEARIALEPGAPPPEGLVEMLRLEGDGWVLHGATILEAAAGGANGLCQEGVPRFVFRRTAEDGRRLVVGYRGADLTAPDSALLCAFYGFRD